MRRGKIRPAGADSGLELMAARAGAQVRSQSSPAQRTAVAVGDHAADGLAIHVAALAEVDERTPGLEHGLLGRVGRDRERGGDLGVTEPAQFAHHQRAALSLGQLLNVIDELAQSRASLGVLLRPTAAPSVHRIELVDLRAPTQQRDRLVVGDPVEPRLYGEIPLARLQAPHGVEHRALQGVERIVGMVDERAAVTVQGW